jgi:hypothetical protein
MAVGVSMDKFKLTLFMAPQERVQRHTIMKDGEYSDT